MRSFTLTGIGFVFKSTGAAARTLHAMSVDGYQL